MAKTKAPPPPADVTLRDMPPNPFGAKPVIKSLDDAEAAFRLWAWILGREATIHHAHETELTNVHLRFAEMKRIDIDGGDDVSFDQMIHLLSDALLKFAESHRGELCPGASKTCKLQHGTIRWVANRDHVDYAVDVTHKDVAATLASRGKLLERLNELLVEIIGAAISSFVSVDLKVSRTAAATAIAKKIVSNSQIQKLGLEFVTGDESVSAEPAAFVRVTDVASRD